MSSTRSPGTITRPRHSGHGPNAPGLLGYFLFAKWGASALVLEHFTVNLIVYLPMVYAFFAFDFPGAIASRLRGAPLPVARAAN